MGEITLFGFKNRIAQKMSMKINERMEMMVQTKRNMMLESQSSSEDTDEYIEKQRKKVIEENIGVQHLDVKWYIIKENNIYYQQWKIFMIFMNFVSSFIYAYYSTFLEHLNEEQLSTFHYMDRAFEYLFIFQMIQGVFVEYHYPSSLEVERNLKKLVKIYITKGTFPYDIITVVPYNKMLKGVLDLKYHRLFYLIKIIRIINGFD